MRLFRRPWGVAATLRVSLVTRGAVDLLANPTLATGDVKLSLDGAAFANITTLPSVVPASGLLVQISLSATELECTKLAIQFVDQTATKAWEDDMFFVETPLAEGALSGKITSGSPTTTTFVSSQLTGSNTDQYKDAYVTFLTGTCAAATKKITAFNAGTDTVTCEALPAAPSVGDVFKIINGL
jgi:hypothetical protein